MTIGDFPGDGPCAGPGAIHSLACACRERAFAELREAAQEIEQRFVPAVRHAYAELAIERLRKALEATR